MKMITTDSFECVCFASAYWKKRYVIPILKHSIRNLAMKMENHIPSLDTCVTKYGELCWEYLVFVWIAGRAIYL